MLNKLVSLETMPQEESDAMPAEQRAFLYDLLASARRNPELILDTLPIELRREWERRLEG